MVQFLIEDGTNIQFMVTISFGLIIPCDGVIIAIFL